MTARLQIGDQWLSSGGVAGDIKQAKVQTRLPRLLAHDRVALPTARIALARHSVDSTVLGKTCLLYNDDDVVLYGRINPGDYKETRNLIYLGIDAESDNPAIPYESPALQPLGALAKEIADNNNIPYNSASSFWNPPSEGLVLSRLLQGAATQGTPLGVLDLLSSCVWEAGWDLRFNPFSTSTVDEEDPDAEPVVTWANRAEAVERLRTVPDDAPVIHQPVRPNWDIGGDKRNPLKNRLVIHAGEQFFPYQDLASQQQYNGIYPHQVDLRFVAPTEWMTGLWAALFFSRFADVQINCKVVLEGFWQAGDLFVANFIGGPLAMAPQHADDDAYQCRIVEADLVAGTSEIINSWKIVDIETPTEPIRLIGEEGDEGAGATEEIKCYFPWSSSDADTLPTIKPPTGNQLTDRKWRPSFTEPEGFTGTLPGTSDDLPLATELVEPYTTIWGLKRLWSADASVAEPWDWDGVKAPRVDKPVFDDAPRSNRVRIGEGFLWSLPVATFAAGTVRYVLDWRSQIIAGFGYYPGDGTATHQIRSSGDVQDTDPSMAGESRTWRLTAYGQRNGADVPNAVTAIDLEVDIVGPGGSPMGNLRNLVANPVDGVNRYTNALIEWDAPLRSVRTGSFVDEQDKALDTDSVEKYEIGIRREGHEDAAWETKEVVGGANTTCPWLNLTGGWTYDVRGKAIAKTGIPSPEGYEFAKLRMPGVAPKTPLTTPGTPVIVDPTGPGGNYMSWTGSTPSTKVAKYRVQRRRITQTTLYGSEHRIPGQWGTWLNKDGTQTTAGEWAALRGTGEWQFRVIAVADANSAYEDSEPSGILTAENTQTTPSPTRIGVPTALQVKAGSVTAHGAHVSALVPTAPGSARWTASHIEFRFCHRRTYENQGQPISPGDPGFEVMREPASAPGTRTSVTPTTLDYDVEYEWTATAISGTAGYADSLQVNGTNFQTDDDPGAPHPREFGQVATPTNPADTNETKNSANLSWTAPPAGVAGYIVDIWEAGNKDATLRSLPVSRHTTATTARGLKSNQDHSWNVRATPLPGWQESDPTEDRTFRTLVDPDDDRPDRPTGLEVEEKVGGAHFEWDVHPDPVVIGYMLRYKPTASPGYSYRRIPGRTTNSYDLGNLSHAYDWDWGVKARVQPGRTSAPTQDSLYRDGDTFRPKSPNTGDPDPEVDDPRNVASPRHTDTTFDVDWDAPADTTGLAGYIVRWQKQAGGREYSQTLHAATTFYRVRNVDAATTYTFSVQAIGRSGWDPSSRVSGDAPVMTDPPPTPSIPSAPAAPTPGTPPANQLRTTSAWLPWTIPADRTNIAYYIVEVRQSGGTWTALPRTFSNLTSGITAYPLVSDSDYDWQIKSVGKNGAPDSQPVAGPSFHTAALGVDYQADDVSPTVAEVQRYYNGFDIGFSQTNKVGTAYYQARWRRHGTSLWTGSGSTQHTGASQRVSARGLSPTTDYDIQARAIGTTVNGNTYANSGWGTVLSVRTKATQSGGGGGGGGTPPPSLPQLGAITGLSAQKFGRQRDERVVISYGGGGPSIGRTAYRISWTDTGGTARTATTTRQNFTIYMNAPSGFTLRYTVQALGNNSSHSNGPSRSGSITF